MTLGWSEIMGLAGIISGLFSVVYTYGVLSHRVATLEKGLDKHVTDDAALRSVLTRIETTLARMDERLAHMEARPWWKGH